MEHVSRNDHGRELAEDLGRRGVRLLVVVVLVEELSERRTGLQGLLGHQAGYEGQVCCRALAGLVAGSAAGAEGRHFAVHLFAHPKHSQKAGPFSDPRLKVDLPFHNRLARSFTGDVSAPPGRGRGGIKGRAGGCTSSGLASGLQNWASIPISCCDRTTAQPARQRSEPRPERGQT